jgi:pimeloyl-ACP methyl ester carboxylesterase
MTLTSPNSVAAEANRSTPRGIEPNSASVSASTYSTHRIPVSRAPGAPPSLTMHAQLCTPARHTPKALQILVHGITYNSAYWDPGSAFPENSYVAAAVSAGYATLAVDRIGYGRSTRTPASWISYPNQAWQLHQLVEYVRSGGLGIDVDVAVFVGHSSGTGLAWAAARYRDVDAVIATGMLHGVSPRGLAPVARGLFARTALPGYFTTRPGMRAQLFHSQDVDRALLSHDENAKDNYTVGEFTTGLKTIYGSASRDTDVPVLIVLGAHDRMVWGPPHGTPSTAIRLLARERRHYRPGLPVQAYVLPDAGHSINYAPNARLWFDHAQQWLDATLVNRQRHGQTRDATVPGGRQMPPRVTS